MPRSIPLLYSDEFLVAADKPSGLVVHRSQQAPDKHTLLSCLRHQLGPEVYPVNRLDRGTSGVLVLGRSREASRALSLAFQNRQIRKTYLALVRGWPGSGQIERSLDGKPAFTHYETVASLELPWTNEAFPTARYALIEVRPGSGIYHQIRRHLRGLGHPVIGDRQHGSKEHNRLFTANTGQKRLMLHSRRLQLSHPEGDRPLDLVCPLPGRLRGLLAQLGVAQEVINRFR